MNVTFIIPTVINTGGVISSIYLVKSIVEKGVDVKVFYNDSRHGLYNALKDLIFKYIYKDEVYLRKRFQCNIEPFNKIENIPLTNADFIIARGMYCSGELEKLREHGFKLTQYLQGEHVTNKELGKVVFGSSLPKITVSSFLATEVERHGGNLLGVVPNGIDNNLFRIIDNVPKNQIGTVYSPHPAKNPQFIKRAFLNFREDFPNHETLMFSTSKKWNELTVNHYYRLPNLSDLPYLYNRCKYWLVLSKSEGFGNPILEAMACGTVVIATKNGGAQDIIRDSENGFLIDHDDYDSLRSIISKLNHSPDQYQNIVDCSQETVKEHTWTNSTDKLLSLIQKVTVVQ